MERLALTLAVVAFFALCVVGMWLGWRRKAREQDALTPFPELPADLGKPTAELEGIYVATTYAGRWQDRIVAGGVGMRGPATLRRYDAGIAVDRHGATSYLIPADAVVDVHTATGMAGKVMGTEALLVVTWRHGDTTLDTGFRGDDIAAYDTWISAERSNT